MARRNDLLRQLIASPHALPPPQPRNLTVAPAAGLPPHARFGPSSPGQVTNSPYSGGVTAGGPLSLVHPQEGPPTFQAPSYGPLTPAGPAKSIITALAPILGATLLGGTGATAPSQAATLPPPETVPAPPSWTGSGFIQHLPPSQSPSSLGPPGPTLTPNPQAGQAALLAALAGQGRKFNPSAGGSNYQRAF